VHGTSRDAEAASFDNLARVGMREHVVRHSMDSHEFRSVLQVLTRSAPDEIYSLAGQSSVGLSFEQPVETIESNAMGTLNLLEAMRILGRPIRLYSAGSGECFGDTQGEAADETTAFHPRSPYAVAKATAHWLVSNYREAYGLHASTGILFNHESPLRSRRFVTRKIVAAACAIASGSRERLVLGNLGVHRDWGWAPEYVEAMWLMLQQPRGDDFVIATGQQHSLAEFAEAAFAHLGLDWRDHTDSSPSLYRPTDIVSSRGNAGKAAAVLGWRPKWAMAQVVRGMVDAERSGAATPS